jgi:hypothetical protein
MFLLNFYGPSFFTEGISEHSEAKTLEIVQK